MKWLALLFLSGNAMALCPGYTYERQLTINSSQVSTGTLSYTNFPVLFQDTDPTLSTATTGGHMLSAGAFDMIFSTNPNGFPLIHWDTETYNNTGTGQTNIWLQVPTVSSSTNTTLWTCYGSTSVTTYQGISTGTWDSNYIGVYHLASTSTITNGQIFVVGSSSNTNPLVVNGSTSSPSGIIDGAASFTAAATDYIDLRANPAMNPPPQAPMTFSAWYYAYRPSNNTTFNKQIVSNAQTNPYTIDISLINNQLQFVQSKVGCTVQGFNYTGAGNAISTGVWHYVTESISGTVSAPFATVSVDGKFDSSVALSAMCASPTAQATGIGASISNAGGAGGSNAGGWDGLIDEVRFSSSARSNDWITTEYNDQLSPSTFMTIGPELGPPGISIKINGTVRVRGNQVIL